MAKILYAIWIDGNYFTALFLVNICIYIINAAVINIVDNFLQHTPIYTRELQNLFNITNSMKKRNC